jgi:hypothetical protein
MLDFGMNDDGFKSFADKNGIAVWLLLQSVCQHEIQGKNIPKPVIIRI